MDAWKVWKNGDREEGRRPSGKGAVKDGSQTPAKGRESQKGDHRDDRPLGKGIRGGNTAQEEGWQFGKGGKSEPPWGQGINPGVPFEDAAPNQGNDNRDPRWQSRLSNPWDNSWLLSQGRAPVVGADNWVVPAPGGDGWVANGQTTDERWHGRTRQWQGWQEDERWQGSNKQQQGWEDDKWWERSWDTTRWQQSDSPPSNWKEERSMLEERLRKAEAHGKSLEAALAAMKGIGKGAEMIHDRHDDDNGRGWHFQGKGNHNNGDSMHHDFGHNMLAQSLGTNQMPFGSTTPRIQRTTSAINRTSGRSLPPPSRRQDAPATPDNAADLWASYRPSTSSSFAIGAAAPPIGAPMPTEPPSTWLNREVQVDERGIAPWQPPLLQNVQVAPHAPAQGRLWAGPGGSVAMAANGASFPGQSYSGYVRTPRGDVQDPTQQMQMARHNSWQFERNSFSSAGGGSCGGMWLEGAASGGGGYNTKGGKATRGPRHHSKGPRDNNNWWYQDQAQAGKDGRRYREPGGGRDGDRAQKVTAVLSRGASLGSAPRARPKSAVAGHATASVRAGDGLANVAGAVAIASPPAEVNGSGAQAPAGGAGNAMEQPGEGKLNAAEVTQVYVEEAAEGTSAANISAPGAPPAEGDVGGVATEEEEAAVASNDSGDMDVEIISPPGEEDEARKDEARGVEASVGNKDLWRSATEDEVRKDETSADNEILWTSAAEDEARKAASNGDRIGWPLAAEDEAKNQAGVDDRMAWPLTAEDETRNGAGVGNQVEEEEREPAVWGQEEAEEGGPALASVTYQ